MSWRIVVCYIYIYMWSRLHLSMKQSKEGYSLLVIYQAVHKSELAANDLIFKQQSRPLCAHRHIIKALDA